MMVSTVGRYDTAPAHLIIISPRFTTAALNEIERKDIDHEAIALARAERMEAEHKKRQEVNALKAEARKVQAALDKAAKEERSRIEKEKYLERNEAAAKAMKMQAARDALERIKARKRTPEYKAREAARERAKRALCVKEAVPAGYVTVVAAAEGSGMTVAGIRAAVIAGRLPGIKSHRIWYVKAADAAMYAAGRKDRCREKLAKICASGGKARHRK